MQKLVCSITAANDIIDSRKRVDPTPHWGQVKEYSYNLY